MLTPTRVMQNVITGFTVGLHAFKRNSVAEEVIISTMHVDRIPAQGVAYRVTRAGAVTPLAQSEMQGKDNAVATVIFDDGTLWLIVAEAVPGGAGSTSKVDIYEYAGAFPALPAPSSAVDQSARDTANAALLVAQAARSKINELLNVIRNVLNIS